MPNLAAKASKAFDPAVLAVLSPNLAARASKSGSAAIGVPAVGNVDELMPETPDVDVLVAGIVDGAPEVVDVVGPTKPGGAPGSKVDCA